MTSKSSNQSDVERKKHEDSIKYLYFSRYLMVRYSVVIFLFANLFWLLILVEYQKLPGIILAGLMTILSGIAAIEQLTKMHNRKSDVPITRIYLWLQIIGNILLACSLFLPFKKQILPFITDQNSVYFMVAFLLAGILLAYFCERRIHNINIGKDKYLKAIKAFKNN
ncbi:MULTISPECIES: PTS cellobiose transporter subunit IIA [Lactobacillus]|uniref:PTS cellobiose transporter subunit IIA n=1 Tax=Lactobacillus melliventris TaxID=1218507 RepID=A0ABX5MZ63_9LACO|nr:MULTISPECIES: PTS cellobiose transporter subunit IIA [Lactobacillus]MBH9990035.1 PTS cellobiose transporter subunit IIA [Lactobacillus sp. M0392]MBI0024305.1 PTS cellobiose transporter subunit IIA [Lactobacillus sp. W8171]MBI0044947.1 PTS cellobiose transporter subunit IIA [Lactobacillus sp. M0393]PXY84158.1 PTS cellobiose transporter subunit IIA [Lactobacillus melliventris]RMC61607.1 PTS cellobiose transporter subunit IIA [Lactobacillus sp. ESL0259]